MKQARKKDVSAFAPGVQFRQQRELLLGAVCGDRINAVDTRFAKVLRFGKTKANIGMDLYNLFNSNTPTTYETVYDLATPSLLCRSMGRSASPSHS